MDIHDRRSCRRLRNVRSTQQQGFGIDTRTHGELTSKVEHRLRKLTILLHVTRYDSEKNQ